MPFGSAFSSFFFRAILFFNLAFLCVARPCTAIIHRGASFPQYGLPHPACRDCLPRLHHSPRCDILTSLFKRARTTNLAPRLPECVHVLVRRRGFFCLRGLIACFSASLAPAVAFGTDSRVCVRLTEKRLSGACRGLDGICQTE